MPLGIGEKYLSTMPCQEPFRGLLVDACGKHRFAAGVALERFLEPVATDPVCYVVFAREPGKWLCL